MGGFVVGGLVAGAWLMAAGCLRFCVLAACWFFKNATARPRSGVSIGLFGVVGFCIKGAMSPLWVLPVLPTSSICAED